MLNKLIVCYMCAVLFACKSNTNPYANKSNITPAVLAAADTANYTIIQWKDTLHDFGTIAAGDSVHLKYNFSNAGNTPLFIFGAQSSCGCTITNFPKEPIMPGESGFVAVTFNSGHLTGNIERTIRVIANTKKSKSSKLSIRGMVQPAAKQNM